MQTTPAEDRKAALRRELLRRRVAMSASERSRMSAAAAALVLGLDAYRAARAVLAYRPLGAEVDPGAVVADALSSSKRVYYPRVMGEGLEFVAGDGEPTEPWRAAETASGEPPAVVLIPGVGFDLRGGRLGRGGGHYDRALAALHRTVRIGIAYEAQIVPEVPRDPWDVPMHCIVTEARVVAVDPRVLEENGA